MRINTAIQVLYSTKRYGREKVLPTLRGSSIKLAKFPFRIRKFDINFKNDFQMSVIKDYKKDYMIMRYKRE